MKYIFYNPNPLGLSVGDCTVRAISKVTGLSWQETYLYLLIPGDERMKSTLMECVGKMEKM